MMAQLVGERSNNSSPSFFRMLRIMDLAQVCNCSPCGCFDIRLRQVLSRDPARETNGKIRFQDRHKVRVHDKSIYEIGYHILPYFLNEWERFKHIPLGVVAHST